MTTTPDYERYGHLGVPHEPQHTAAALDAEHALTADLTRAVRNAAHILRDYEDACMDMAIATFWANWAERRVDELRTNLADILTEHLSDDEDQDDLTEDDGWHCGGVMTATPDGVVVTEAGTGDDEELVICF